MKRFLVIAVLCLFSLPAKATVVTSNIFTGPFDFTVVGEIPSPIEIGASFYFQIAPLNIFEYDYFIAVTIGTQAGSYDEFASGCSAFAVCNRAPRSGTFTISDDARDIHVQIRAPMLNGVTLLDANAFFILPDGLSIAAPVPEASTWAMLLLGFAGIGLIAYRRRYCMASVR